MSTTMRVLVLGGGGFVGGRIASRLRNAGRFSVTVASRRVKREVASDAVLVLDGLDTAALRRALQSHDAVINCITGSAATIVRSARSLVEAQLGSPCHRLIHMSSMAAFGNMEGDLDDETPLGEGGGWYAEAKREAERVMSAAAGPETGVALLRPGCVHGAGSHLWVGRIGDWLRQRRLGDLGSAGDGWSNLVHVDDVAQAVHHALELLRPGQSLRANLAAPDSPRWNDYFVALGCRLGKASPVARIHPRQLQLDAQLAAAPLRAWERIAPRLGVPARFVPPALPPSLLTLFAMDRRMRAGFAGEQLDLKWTPFNDGLADSAQWYLAQRAKL